MSQPVTISVVIPCYNAAAFVAETIRSALGQTLAPLEVIVVDDGSSDDSAAVAAACGPAVKVIRQANTGAAGARNTGVRVAAGNWIAFLDADDLWVRDRLEKLACLAATADPDIVCLFNDLDYVAPDGSRSHRPTPTHLLDGDAHVNLICDWLVNPSALLVRAAAARAVPFPEGVRHVEDQQFVMLLNRRGRFVHVPEALTGYRRRAGQLTADPRHVLIATRFNTEFVRKHSEWYTPADETRVRTHYANWLVRAHESAYWRRQYDVVREIRTVYFEIHPEPDPNPPLFNARLYPRWLVQVKDRLDRLFRRPGRRNPAGGAG